MNNGRIKEEKEGKFDKTFIRNQTQDSQRNVHGSIWLGVSAFQERHIAKAGVAAGTILQFNILKSHLLATW